MSRMGLDGALRLKNGYTRVLTASERSRRYIFLSKDTKLIDYINNGKVPLYFNDELVLSEVTVDTSGRISGGSKVINRIIALNRNEASFKMVDGAIYVSC